MKRGLSTGRPTNAEAARIMACKEGPCVACLAWAEGDQAPLGFTPVCGCDYHHLLSGGRRRGHMFGVGVCPWHHRGVPNWGCTVKEMRVHYGPSLMDGSRLFHAAYGSDDELLAGQNLLLEVA
ncbi:Ref family recombination enhancement nuclease [Stenotrophomonas sp. AB1(2024)]|uniref:Ref family recombination enhancement nuclease n=1 Tax=Stenotrophomonas sp. AB1(2024) TaxID=3132215 RepID=UPI00309923B4